ncbi:hypothetical protein LY76DRAFT_596161 [Colletotrichum caudatum]|nr:hypothetical protein LY76DRAFT_596161 [Colletotrichum caudatum]
MFVRLQGSTYIQVLVNICLAISGLSVALSCLGSSAKMSAENVLPDGAGGAPYSFTLKDLVGSIWAEHPLASWQDSFWH